MKRILVQAGHMRPMEPGFEADTGAGDEAAIVAQIQKALVRLLNADPNFHAIPMPGLIPNGTTCDGAIFLHCDGVDDHSVGGFSFGFPDIDVNRRLADLIRAEFNKLAGHPRDRGNNITGDEAKYYGFRVTATPGPEVLVEHGFTSNPAEHQWMLDNIHALAHAELNAFRRFFGFAPTPVVIDPDGDPTPVVDHGPVTPNSVLHAVPRAPADRAVAFLLSDDHGEYSTGDVRAIVRHYYETALSVGLDPLLVVAQMSEETGHLTSFWSQRPRRNPAGIGVTGKPGEGLSFPDWATAVRAHTGRLLAYSIAGDGNAAQSKLIREALSFRPLGSDKRGVAPLLGGLAGTWAHDPNYAKTVAAVANRIRAFGQ